MMFYRRKYYVVNNDFVSTFNSLFNETNLPNQLKHGARLVGRWMAPLDELTTELFAIWEYDSYKHYRLIESKVRGDAQHVVRINIWYNSHGGREYIYKHCILKVKNEQLYSTLTNETVSEQHDVRFWLKE